MNLTISSVVCVLVQVRTKICLMPRGIFCCGIGNGELACILFRKWWSPNKLGKQMGTRMSWLQLLFLSLQLLQIVQCLFFSLNYWVYPISNQLEYQKSKLYLRSKGYSLKKIMKETFFTDQFVFFTSVRLPSGYVRKRHQNWFHSGTIYNYAASGLIWVENQVSLGEN